ncbi:hypothetical protein BAUCODRAFT_204974 [Baudoinia panamericana UAMH 10762]|uniref:JmjC domain-containing protein n=1 Tax=Baudoinia panamericana (strain UAMH 10762) TaxID=717646 RepID=M2MWB4_BAUPA|nr:uncharacterized protein BAUCODRAFT_204974 [Baudoinia panamericana UAMH 10762]EMD01287.1 hypothetical protein BAUCODRAFT_204974 [Baudoinia panamericana UAMH 10762]
MLGRRPLVVILQQCRQYSSAPGFKPVPTLPNASLDMFRQHAFNQAMPALLPRQIFQGLPAVQKWFAEDSNPHAGATLNRSYLARYGSTIVPLEISHNDQFNRIEQPLSFFLECVYASSSTYRPRPSRYFSAYVPNARAIKQTKRSNEFFSAATITPPTARIYLAQAPVANLPHSLRADVPTPDIVLKAGQGDIYDSSIWLGQAPTYTPLHRDPNPNLFVQLAGTKIVRLFSPEVGRAIFAKVQEQIGGAASATMRGEEMMHGAERKALEDAVWNEQAAKLNTGFEAELETGDGMFIPKGWWHSIKGMGSGMTGSVSI